MLNNEQQQYLERRAGLDQISGLLLDMLTFCGYEQWKEGRNRNWVEAHLWAACSTALVQSRMCIERNGTKLYDVPETLDVHFNDLIKYAGRWPRFRTKYDKLRYTWKGLTNRHDVSPVRKGRRARTESSGADAAESPAGAEPSISAE